jgi:scyllo-inositol 2-dehydrogenase (NADP+)
LPNNKINTAIVGFGLSGRIFHAPFLHCHPGFNLLKVVERNHQYSKSKYPYVNVVKDFYEVINDPNIDLVVVCTPNIYHYELAKESLLAGKHVVIEKPITTTSKEAEELIEIAEKVNKYLFVYHNRRWDGDFLTIEKLMLDNTLGKIAYFESHFDRYVPEVSPKRTWKNTHQPASGVLFDLGSHLIHQAITLFGLPQTLSATINTNRKGSNVDDNFELIMQYPTLTAVLKSDMLMKDHELKYVIKGEKGTYTQYGIDPQEVTLNKGIIPKGDNWCNPEKTNYGILKLLRDDKVNRMETSPGNYMSFYNNIYDVLTHNQSLTIEPLEGYDVIRICEAAIESNAQQKTIQFE